jgi:hypothetical protein
MSWALARTASSIPPGGGRGSGFRWYRKRKAAKNRLHLDIGVGSERTIPIETRRQRVDAEASRLAGLGALLVGVNDTEGLDHYGVAMKDPESAPPAFRVMAGRLG